VEYPPPAGIGAGGLSGKISGTPFHTRGAWYNSKQQAGTKSKE
jgi:hypothetical protein